MRQQITLFPDSNFFFHSRDLEQIDWHNHPQLTKSELIRLLVCNPVHREIDNHKYTSAGRIGRRARKFNSILRALVFDELSQYVLREASPRVVLVEANALQPSKALALDYSIMDHRLLGCVRSYSDQNPTSTGYLLRNDGSAYALAKHHEIDAIVVPDDWLLPPDDRWQSKARALEQENRKLKQAEPSFALALKNDSGQQLESLEIECKDFLQVSSSEVTALVEELRNRFPERPTMGVQERPRADFLYNSRFLAQMESTQAPRREPQAYQQWLKECENVLSGLHMSLQLRAVLSVLYVVAHNEGTRPASNVTVEISVTEPFLLVVQSDEDDVLAVSTIDKEHPVKLPPPPALSRGSSSLFDLGGDSVVRVPELRGVYMDNVLARRPDELFISPPRPEVPVRQVRLQCKEWMHGMESKSIRVEVHAAELKPEMTGVLTCTVHASNLTQAHNETFQIRVTTKSASVSLLARELVDDLVQDEA